MATPSSIIGPAEPILVTGAAGFIGAKVVEHLLEQGFQNIRCFVRSSSASGTLEDLRRGEHKSSIELINGDLLSREDCERAAKGVAVIYHLAAGRGAKSFPDAFLNSVVTTRNLLEAARQQPTLKRFVNISSFSVYSTRHKTAGVLDETCPLEKQPASRGDAYCFAKVKQDEIVAEYGKTHRIPYVIIRPGVVYGPGNRAIHGRVGIGTFGLFLHLGGPNKIPLTYVDNCAEAICLAGLKPGVDGEAFNIVDDELPSSRRFLREYKRKVRAFRSIYVPHALSYAFCWLWEKYSHWSQGQLPPSFNRAAWHAYWKKTRYSNAKVKRLLDWTPRIKAEDGLRLFFLSCKEKTNHA
jgi:nucleoside-diphosphate-sugar epimerase